MGNQVSENETSPDKSGQRPAEAMDVDEKNKCWCGDTLESMKNPYPMSDAICDGCGEPVSDYVYHCANKIAHPNGYDLCLKCHANLSAVDNKVGFDWFFFCVLFFCFDLFCVTSDL